MTPDVFVLVVKLKPPNPVEGVVAVAVVGCADGGGPKSKPLPVVPPVPNVKVLVVDPNANAGVLVVDPNTNAGAGTGAGVVVSVGVEVDVAPQEVDLVAVSGVRNGDVLVLGFPDIVSLKL